MPSDYSLSLNKALHEGKSFVIWRFPEEEQLYHAGPAEECTWDGNMPEEAFVFAPFNPQKHPVYGIGVSGSSSSSKSEAPYCAEKSEYLDLVAHSVQAIASGNYQKIVGARAIHLPAFQEEPLDAFHRLCVKNPNAFCYLWFSPSTGLWMGASPELLMRREEGWLETMALAGTQRPDTVFSEKEVKEQDFVLNYLQEQLNQWSNEVQVSPKEEGKSGHLLHLRNRIKAKLNVNYPGDFEAMQALSPSPAVAGLPKEKAIRFIESNEGMDRTYYSGYLGLVSKQKTQVYVNLRCLQQVNTETFQYVGAGFTAQSDPEQEWIETEEKAKIVLSR